MVYAKAGDHELKLDLYWHPDALKPEPLIVRWVVSGLRIWVSGIPILLLPIMGDHRAWHPETHTWDAERFRGIMQTHALDNQLCIVVAVQWRGQLHYRPNGTRARVE